MGVAIGDYVLDLTEIADLFTGPIMSQKKSSLQGVRNNSLLKSNLYYGEHISVYRLVVGSVRLILVIFTE